METSITADDIINHIALVSEELQDLVIKEKLKLYEKQQLNNEEILVSSNHYLGLVILYQ